MNNETMLRIRIDPKLRDQFKGLTAMNGTNMNAVILDFIKDYVEKEGKKR